MDLGAPPIYIASGPWSDPSLCDPSLVQGIVTKSVTWEAREGNAGDTVESLASDTYLNWQGLPNAGCEAFCLRTLPRWRESGHRFIVSVAGQTADDYRRCVEMLVAQGVASVELNLSCPNAPGVDVQILTEVVPQIPESCEVFVKVAPNPFAVEATGEIIQQMADRLAAVVCGNSLPAALMMPSGLVQRGGMSGAWLKPVALGVAHTMSVRSKVPVIGCGGIRSAHDVREFLAAGCAAVQLASVCLRGAYPIVDIVTDLVAGDG